MYIGDGQIVNALNPGAGVQVSGLHDMPYVGAVRRRLTLTHRAARPRPGGRLRAPPRLPARSCSPWSELTSRRATARSTSSHRRRPRTAAPARRAGPEDPGPAGRGARRSAPVTTRSAWPPRVPTSCWAGCTTTPKRCGSATSRCATSTRARRSAPREQAELGQDAWQRSVQLDLSLRRVSTGPRRGSRPARCSSRPTEGVRIAALRRRRLAHAAVAGRPAQRRTDAADVAGGGRRPRPGATRAGHARAAARSRGCCRTGTGRCSWRCRARGKQLDAALQAEPGEYDNIAAVTTTCRRVARAGRAGAGVRQSRPSSASSSSVAPRW